MIIQSTFLVDEKNHESMPFSSPGFPYICFYDDMDMFPDKTVAWHWHTSCEINYIEKGTFEYRTPDQGMILKPGDAVFINTGVLHYCRAIGGEKATQYSLLFHSDFLSGAYGSIFEEKYFAPVMRCPALQSWMVHPDNRIRQKMINALMDSIELTEREPDGYEFSVRNSLSDFWYGLYADTKELRSSAPVRNKVDLERVRQMVDFIHEYYAEPLTVDDIAAVAGIGARECSRCFRKNIGVSPIEHLTNTRIRKATEMLLCSSMSVLEISEACGFSSSSYFSKVFREQTGLTPREYQKKNMSEK